MNEYLLLEHIKDRFPSMTWAFYGSRVTVDPPPTDTDLDVLVIHNNALKNYLMKDLEFIKEGNRKYGDGPFSSFRKDKLNIMLVRCPIFYERCLVACRVCRKLNVKNKKARIKIYEAIKNAI